MAKPYDINNLPHIENQIIAIKDMIEKASEFDDVKMLEKLLLKYENSLQKLKDYHNIA